MEGQEKERRKVIEWMTEKVTSKQANILRLDRTYTDIYVTRHLELPKQTRNNAYEDLASMLLAYDAFF